MAVDVVDSDCSFCRLSVNERVAVLTSLRLDMNKAYIKKWPQVKRKKNHAKPQFLMV